MWFLLSSCSQPPKERNECFLTSYDTIVIYFCFYFKIHFEDSLGSIHCAHFENVFSLGWMGNSVSDKEKDHKGTNAQVCCDSSIRAAEWGVSGV